MEPSQESMDFEASAPKRLDSAEAAASSSHSNQPLAERMRPRRLEEVIGQTELLGPDGPLYQAIVKDQVRSFIFWGPPGTGKTTLARIIADHTQKEFIALSGVFSGVKELREAAQRAKYLQSTRNQATVLFIDEIHRLNKSQQDALLPYVEDGTVTLIGATTENPSFEVNAALLSRATVYVLKPLSPDEVQTVISRALQNPTNGLALLNVEFPEAWIEKLAKLSGGDARRALTLLERACLFLKSKEHAEIPSIETPEGMELFEKAVGYRAARYDKAGEGHYNTISAFIKSMRDSDPDAAIYYLASMLDAGEDPLFIVRRMVIFASEDIGNADPRALQIALAVKDAVHFIGMPEARINLGHGVTYLACAPKSNASYMAINEALEVVRENPGLEIPLHIRNAPTKLMKNLGYGKDYRYAHSEEAGYSKMSNLPDELKGRKFYHPKDSGLEKQIKQSLEQRERK